MCVKWSVEENVYLERHLFKVIFVTFMVDGKTDVAAETAPDS